MKENSKVQFETKCVHSGIDEYEFGPVVPPIYQTSTFKFKSAQHGASLFAGEEKGYIYTRMLNPTIQAMEDAIAELEGGHKALGCGSGMAAVHTIFASLTQSGDHVVCSTAVYGPTTTLLNTIMKKYGVETTFVDTSNLEEVKKAIKPNTKVVYVETPGNPTLCISDLTEISKIAHQHNAQVVVDNTFMSPALQNPIVKSIRYPGLKSHPHYELGLKQHKCHGGMITIELAGGLDAGKLMMNSVKLFQLAVSLGGVESLIEHPASMTHASMGKEARLVGGITDGLVRISVGIENVNDLIEDLDSALHEVEKANLVHAG